MSKLSLSGTVLEIMVEHIIKQQRAGASSPRERQLAPRATRHAGAALASPGRTDLSVPAATPTAPLPGFDWSTQLNPNPSEDDPQLA
jgi:hypothetical protein